MHLVCESLAAATEETSGHTAETVNQPLHGYDENVQESIEGSIAGITEIGVGDFAEAFDIILGAVGNRSRNDALSDYGPSENMILVRIHAADVDLKIRCVRAAWPIIPRSQVVLRLQANLFQARSKAHSMRNGHCCLSCKNRGRSIFDSRQS